MRLSRERSWYWICTVGPGPSPPDHGGQGKKVIGAEIISAAVENARENAADNGVENVEFFCGDAGDIALKSWQGRTCIRM